MLNRMPVRRLFLILALLLSTQMWSQRSSATGARFRISKKGMGAKRPMNYINYIGFGGTLGSASYIGDLCDGFRCTNFSPILGLTAEYRYSESLMFRTEVSYMRLKQDDANDKWAGISRGLSFYSNTLDFNFNIVYDIFEFNKMFRRRQQFAPYIQLGAGFVTVNPKAKLAGTSYKLRNFQTEGVDYKGISPTLSYGLGVRHHFNPLNYIALEATYRYTFTDYLDDVSGNYDPSKRLLSVNDPVRLISDRRWEHGANKGSATNNTGVRGGPNSNDMYFYGGLRFVHTFKVTKQRYNINSRQSKFRIIRSIHRK